VLRLSPEQERESARKNSGNSQNVAFGHEVVTFGHEIVIPATPGIWLTETS
jgi:hypothetical protein